jgi:hypothetical protein
VAPEPFAPPADLAGGPAAVWACVPLASCGVCYGYLDEVDTGLLDGVEVAMCARAGLSVGRSRRAWRARFACRRIAVGVRRPRLRGRSCIPGCRWLVPRPLTFARFLRGPMRLWVGTGTAVRRGPQRYYMIAKAVQKSPACGSLPLSGARGGIARVAQRSGPRPSARHRLHPGGPGNRCRPGRGPTPPRRRPGRPGSPPRPGRAPSAG